MTRQHIFYVVQLILYVSVQFIGVCPQDQVPIVNTTLGLVRGVIADDGDYFMYLGIPFAKVNEDNPFGAALPHPEYDGIFEANDDSAICPQREEFNHTIVGTLDCLHLNVHVPASASPTNLLPVFVWIFGGGFEIGFFGRFLYGPKFLVRHDIVFVTINYRVGPYGFMCLDIPEVPGNEGLKDQLMALRWIRENIANFGGDPDKVTIAGNSAGSMSADQHLLRKNDGPKLFHKVILQSGTVMIPNMGAPFENPSLRMAQHLGFETDNVTESITFLATIDPLVIIETSQELNIGFGTCVEKEFEGVEAFILEDVTEVTDVPAVKDMPIMIGFNNDEGFSSKATLLVIGRDIYLIYMTLLFDASHSDFRFIAETVENFYSGGQEINNDNVQGPIDFVGDLMFIYPTHRSMKRFLDNDVGDMYLYKFSYDGERNFVKHRENMTGGGATHADELGYLFDISYMDEPNSEDQLVIDRMTAMWANFVKISNPTPVISELLPKKWESITKSNPYYHLEIDAELSVGNRPFRDRMAFWDLLLDGYGHMLGGTTNTESEVYRFIMNKLLKD